MATLRGLWQGFVDALARVFSRRALPSPRDPAPGTRDFLRHPKDALAVTDARAEAWVAHLRAELPFPQPLYGTAEPPANARELHERLGALDAEIAAAIARAAASDQPFSDVEPDWFVTLADRFLPLAAWYAGVGLASGAPELPERLRDLSDRARRIPGINRALEWLGDQVELLTRQNAGFQAAWFTLLKVHLEALLRPLSPRAEVEVSFDFPTPGARVAELVPPPAPGSATAGAVGRVLCPAVVLRLRGEAGEVVLQRGAHVRAR